MARLEIVGMISFVREKLVQNMVRVVACVRKKVGVHVRSQLRWRGIFAGVVAELDSMSYRCIWALLIGQCW